MRDTLIALALFVSVAGGYLYFKKAGLLEPSVRPAAAAKQKSGKTSPFVAKRQSHSFKGAKHDEESARHDDDQQVAHYGQNEGASSDLTEAESLPSIYQDSERHDARPAIKAESSPKPVKKTAKKKFVHGVPVHAYIHSKKNSLAVGEISDDSGLGMRVFVQCMELKKRGPEYVGPQNCEALLAARDGRPGGLSQY